MSDPFFIPTWAQERLKAETEPKALTPEQQAYAELARSIQATDFTPPRRPGRPKGSKNNDHGR